MHTASRGGGSCGTVYGIVPAAVAGWFADVKRFLRPGRWALDIAGAMSHGRAWEALRVPFASLPSICPELRSWVPTG